jgi:amidase
MDYRHPLAEPRYTGKRTLDFSAFQGALAALTRTQIDSLDARLANTTVPDMQALMDRGELTAVELVTYYVERILRYDVGQLNAVMELNPAALEIAQQLDSERAAGSVRGMLHGIPVLVKDNIATGDGMHAAAGAWAMREWRPQRDAFLVQQLRKAGAVILGKTNLSEWANYMDPFMPNGFSVLGGQTRCPCGPFDPVGSSSGSAVAVAASLAALAVGSETLGSIVEPALANAVVGLKVSMGLISRDHIIPLIDWMDVPGPMARTVTDVAAMLGAMTGIDRNDRATQVTAGKAPIDYTQSLKIQRAAGMRVGIVTMDEVAIETLAARFAEWMEEPESVEKVRNEIRQWDERMHEQAKTLAALGIEMVKVPAAAIPPEPPMMKVIDYSFRDALNRFLQALGDEAPIKSLAEIVAINSQDLDNRAPYGQGHLVSAQNCVMTAEEYAVEAEAQRSVRERLEALFAEYQLDALLSRSYVYAAAGFPALSVPSGYDEKGQPYDLKLLGDFLGEDRLIALGYAYEQATKARVAPDLARTLDEIAAVKRDHTGERR